MTKDKPMMGVVVEIVTVLAILFIVGAWFHNISQHPIIKQSNTVSAYGSLNPDRIMFDNGFRAENTIYECQVSSVDDLMVCEGFDRGK